MDNKAYRAPRDNMLKDFAARMERPYIQITENVRLEKPSDDIKLSFMTPHELTTKTGRRIEAAGWLIDRDGI